jgi:hypothetical protein
MRRACAIPPATWGTGNLHRATPSVIFCSFRARSTLTWAHDLPLRLTHVLAQPACTVCGYHPGRPSIAGWTPPTMQLGDHFPYGWLAERVYYSGSGFPHQVDVPDSHGDGAWRSRDVEPCLYDPTTISVYRARGRRSTQTASRCSVVFGSWRAGVDREIQSGSSSSETGAARSFPSHF